MATWLTPHFSLEELIASQHRQFDNHPPSAVRAVLTETAIQMERVRQLLGDQVITVSSGYRCPQLNRAVGGAEGSAHLTGHAVDFNCFSYGPPLRVCRTIDASDLPFDQLIQEGAWVHLSFDPRLRRQVLTRVGKSYRGGL